MNFVSKDIVPLVSIITVNWNGTDVTLQLLKSIEEFNTYANVEVIVVDNCSKEDPASAINSIFPNVNVLRAERNLGFAGGNNLGISIAKGEYYFLVNNDTEFTSGLIEALLETFNEHPEAGIVSPKFHYYYEKGRIEYAGYRRVNVLTGRNSMIGCRELDFGQYNTAKEVAYAHGGAMIVSAKAVRIAGLMPEIYFLYYEEFDWCERFKESGYRVYYQPRGLIYHKESYTTGKDSPLKTYYINRNRVLFMRRNVRQPGLSLFYLYFVFITIPKNSFSFLLKVDKEKFLAFWRSILWNVNNPSK